MSLVNGFSKSQAFCRSFWFLFLVVSFFVVVGFSMPRMDRRSAIAYINDDKERDVTFFKRRGGLFKSVADLSVVTGASVAVVLETENERMHSFGTPSADPIVGAFLSGAPLAVPLADEATTTRVAQLQSEVARLDMNCMKEYKENQLSIKRMKQIQEQCPGMAANLMVSKEEDLSPGELNNLSNEISRVHEDIGHRLPQLHHGHKAMTGGASMTQNMLPSSGPPSDRMRTTPSQVHSLWDHHLPQHQMLSSPLQSPPGHIVAPGFPQNDANSNSTSRYNLGASPLLVYSGGNDFIVNGPFGYESWGYALSDQPFRNEFLETDASLGYNATDVGQSSMGNGEWVDKPQESSSS
nr:agamous-like MADS-box protein MADS3 [Aegilops tauschii subsp. strangulata]